MTHPDTKLREIRSIYAELQGYLIAAPEIKDFEHQNGLITDSYFWLQYNKALKRLNKVTNDKYFEFILAMQSKHSKNRTYVYISVLDYRNKLTGLIFKLHSDYFSDEPSPISKSPTGQIIFNQNISQTLSVSIDLFQKSIEEKIHSYEDDSKEKNFLQQLKDYTSSAKDVTQILSKASEIGQELGMAAGEIWKLLL